jgi:hypothetical protein
MTLTADALDWALDICRRARDDGFGDFLEPPGQAE